MKFIFTFLFLFVGTEAIAAKLQIDGASGCAILTEGVRCWNDGKLINPETLGVRFVNPTKVVLWGENPCVIDESRLKCWDEKGEVTIFDETGVLDAVLVGGTRSSFDSVGCFQKKKQIVCEPSINWKKTPPVVINAAQEITSISPAFYGGLCYTADGRLVCVNPENQASIGYQLPPRALRNAQEVKAGKESLCVRDDLGWQCWTSVERYSLEGTIKIPNRLKDIQKVSAGDDIYCGIRRGQVECWGRWNSDYALDVPKLRNAREVSVSGKTVCALDDRGITCWGEFFSSTAWEQGLKDTAEVVGGLGFVCARSQQGELSCFKIVTRNNSDTIYTPIWTSISDPTKVLVEQGHSSIFTNRDRHARSCGVKDQKFSCSEWDKSSPLRKLFPPSYRPSSFSTSQAIWKPKPGSPGTNVSSYLYCGIQSEKLTCATSSGEIVKIPKEVSKPVDVFIRAEEICIADSKGIFCWGGWYGEGRRFTEWTSPKKVMIQSGILCGLDSERALCLLDSSQDPKRLQDGGKKGEPRKFLQVTGLKNPISIHRVDVGIPHPDHGTFALCVIDEEGMKCDSTHPDSPLSVTGLRDFQRLYGKPIGMTSSSGWDAFYCIQYLAHDGRVKVRCSKPYDLEFGKLAQSPARQWSALGGERFNLEELDQTLQLMSREVTPLRSWVLKNLAQFLSEKAPNCVMVAGIAEARPECRSEFSETHAHSILASRWLALQLIAPLILSGDSKRFDEYYIPPYNHAVKEVTEFLRQRNVDFNRSPRTALETKTALKTLEIVLRASLRVLRPDESKQAMEILRAVVRLSAQQDPQGLQSLHAVYEANRNVRDSLAQSPQMSFLAGMLDASMEALK